MRAASPRVPEKVVQAHVVTLIRSIGGHAYILGTKRRKGDYQGTQQTPGIPDVYALLPSPQHRPGPGVGLWIECKAVGGRLRPEQAEFRRLCAGALIPHVVGGVDDVIAFLVAGGWLKSTSVPHYRLSKAAAAVPAESGVPRVCESPRPDVCEGRVTEDRQ